MVGEADASGIRARSVRFELPRTLTADAPGRVCVTQGEGGSAASSAASTAPGCGSTGAMRRAGSR